MKKVFSLVAALMSLLLASCLTEDRPGAPAELQGLSAVPGNHSVTLTWNRSAHAVSYTAFLIRENDSLRSGGVKCTVKDTTCVLFGIPNGVPVSFAVYARGSSDGDYTAVCDSTRDHASRPVKMSTCLVVSETVLATAPARQPVHPTASLILGEAVIFWDAVAGGDTIDAVYEARAVQDTSLRCGDTALLAGADRRLSCALTGVMAIGIPYTFRIFGRNSLGMGPLSEATATLMRAGVPTAPGEVKGTPGSGRVTVSWKAPASNGGLAITHYKAYATVDTNRSCDTKGELTCTITGLRNGAAYVFAVKAANSLGAGPIAVSDSVRPRPDAPDAPTAVTASAGYAEATVSWTAPVSDGGTTITGYKAYAESDSAKSCVTSGATTCVVYQLINGTPYRFVVRAVNNAGVGAVSAPAPAVTPTAPPGWIGRTSGTSKTLNAVATSGTFFIAVGDSGTILTSPNGLNWTPRASGTAQSLRGVAYGNGTWTVVGDSGTILTSTASTPSQEGANWTPRNTGTQGLNAVVRAGSIWVAVGQAGTILMAPDGGEWSVSTSGVSDNLYGVARSGSVITAVGANGAVLTSPGGKDWTWRNAGTTDAFNAVAWTGTAFVAVGSSNSPQERYSPDGVTWTSRISGASASTPLYGVTWIGNRLLIVGGSGTVLGASSEEASSSSLGTLVGNPRAVAGTATVWVVVGANGSITTSSP